MTRAWPREPMASPVIPYLTLPEIPPGFLLHVRLAGRLFDAAHPPSIKPFGMLVALGAAPPPEYLTLEPAPGSLRAKPDGSSDTAREVPARPVFEMTAAGSASLGGNLVRLEGVRGCVGTSD